MPETAEPYSYHHFLFPFRWDLLPEKFNVSTRKEKISFDKRTELSVFENFICQNNSSWQRIPFSLQQQENTPNHIHYNEFTYFHDFVRKVIYDFDTPHSKDIEDGEKKENNALGELRYYEFELQDTENYYVIEHISRLDKEDKDVPSVLRLKVDGISLHAFNTGIGILTFNLSNYLHRSLPEVRYINEFGRRIYPQFIRPEGLIKTKEIFLADTITLNLKGKDISLENFETNQATISVNNPFCPPAFIKNLFPVNFCFIVNSELDHPSILINRVLDDRMFFVSWIGDDSLVSSVKGEKYKICDWWYGYIFGDKRGKSIADSDMQKEYTMRHTYARWSEYGTLFGVSRDSFVSVSETAATLASNDSPPLGEQINSIYYTIVVLCLAQRATILKFSAEVTYLADITGKDDHKDLKERVKNLYKNYIEFVNKIYFREVTSHVQGIELYEQLQKTMNIPKDAEDLDKEIGELFNYVRLEAEDERVIQERKLTRLAAWFLPPTLVISIFGMNVWENKNFPIKNLDHYQFAWEQFVWTIIIVVPISLIAIFLILKQYINKRK